MVVRILTILFVIGTMFPAFSKCWDEYILPKWYVSLFILLVFVFLWIKGTLSINEKLFQKALTESSAIGIVFQVSYVLFHFTSQSQEWMIVGIRGTFDNPCGLAVVICLLLPLLYIGRSQERITKKESYSLFLFTVAGVLLIVFSRSRTGMLVLAIYSVIALFNKIRKPYFLVLSMILCLLVVSNIAITKTASSKGRLFILNQTVELIKEHPFKGYGRGGFGKNYMLKQSEYFQSHPLSEYVALADNIKHPLNEFLLLWVNYGVVGPLVLAFITLFPLVILWNSPIARMLSICLFVFSCFSYPFSLPLPVFFMIGVLCWSLKDHIVMHNKYVKPIASLFLCFSFVLMSCSFYIDKTLSSAAFYSSKRKHLIAEHRYTSLNKLFISPVLQAIFRDKYVTFLYNYTYQLFIMGKNAEASIVIGRCQSLVTDYDMVLLSGDIFKQLHDYQSALDKYSIAHDMCPNRFAPLEGRFDCYIGMGKCDNGVLVAQEIIEKSIKGSSPETVRIKKKAIDFLNNHIINLN